MMSDVAVSVIIPVYNAAEFLDECLESVVKQTIGFEHVEVVAVDDGSTDGSGALLDTWAERYPRNIRVVHQENSGAPGGPRNRGIDLATGTFLFFADPDDHLGEDALRRMVEVAERNDSDVVLGRVRGVGRGVPVEPYAANVERGDVWSVKGVHTLTPHKLFRRSLVTEHGLRFAEGARLAEEQPFILPAYLKARCISVVADYDCYYLVDREGFAHLTKQQPPAEAFFAPVRAGLRSVIDLTEPGERRNELIERIARIQILAKFGPRFHHRSAERQESYARVAAEVLHECVPPEAVASLPRLIRVRDRLLREGGRLSELLSLSRHDGLSWTELEPGHDAVEWLDGGRSLAVRVRSPYYLDGGVADVRHSLVLRHPDGFEWQVPAARAASAGGPMTAQVVLDLSSLHQYALLPGKWELLLRAATGDGKRHEFPLSLPEPGGRGRRRVSLHGGRPMVVWLSHRSRKARAVLVAADWRTVARRVLRRPRR
ncbi:glycosyltransferase family A protein [Streptomyces sp. CC224B]|uniref:glycosyltransferase family 2 protein n=1 Tax=Streptomyces sp. CC224B TaxID=3044571 RepID=UPI0024A916A2|nr:glycosyltransferase family A protein [Streptomyces sp. CC224B]